MKNLHTESYYNGEREFKITIEEENERIITTIFAVFNDGREVTMDRITEERNSKSIEDLMDQAKTIAGMYPHIHGTLHKVE